MPITVDGQTYANVGDWNRAMDARAVATEGAGLPSAATRDLAVSPDLLSRDLAPFGASKAAAAPNIVGERLSPSGNLASREGTMQFWMEQGVPAHVAAGIADRVNAESGFKPTIFGDSGTSGGLYQHHADRLARLQNFAAQQGKAWTDPLVQHQFALSEVRGGDAIAAKHWQEIINAPDRQTAAMLWDRYFERSAAGPGAGGGGRRMAGRFGGMGPGVPAPGLPEAAAPQAAPPSSLGRALGGSALNLQLSPEAPPSATAAAGPARAMQHAMPLQPVPLPPAPNLYGGYQDALASILNGQRRGMGSIFG